MAEPKIYVGNGVSKFDGEMVSCSLCLTDLPQEHMFEYNGKKYIKLNVSSKKAGEDEYGKTHYITVDTFKPDTPKTPTAPVVAEKVEEDLPF